MQNWEVTASLWLIIHRDTMDSYWNFCLRISDYLPGMVPRNSTHAFWTFCVYCQIVLWEDHTNEFQRLEAHSFTLGNGCFNLHFFDYYWDWISFLRLLLFLIFLLWVWQLMWLALFLTGLSLPSQVGEPALYQATHSSHVCGRYLLMFCVFLNFGFVTWCVGFDILCGWNYRSCRYFQESNQRHMN